MATAIDRLMQLKGEVEQAKLDKAGIEGALQQNMNRLKDEFNCRTLPAAVAKLEQMKEQKESLTTQIANAVAKLESSYEW